MGPGVFFALGGVGLVFAWLSLLLASLPYDVRSVVMPWAATRAFNASMIPHLFGKVVVVTGGNSGIGYEAALQIALQGATVVIACRSKGKCEAARDRMGMALGERGPGSGMVWDMQLDLASLASVRDFAAEFKTRFKRLDVLVNNGGVMASPPALTHDGTLIFFGGGRRRKSTRRVAGMGDLRGEEETGEKLLVMWGHCMFERK